MIVEILRSAISILSVIYSFFQ